MKVVTSVQENAEDIYAEAQQINKERAAKTAVVEDEDTRRLQRQQKILQKNKMLNSHKDSVIQ